MHPRYALVALITSVSSMGQIGCFASKCTDSAPMDGGVATTTKDNCVEFQMGRTYEGTPVPLSATIASSTGKVQVGDQNGNIDVDRANPAGATISMEATPFDIEPANEDGKARAIQVMNTMPAPTVATDSAGVVTIESTLGGMRGWHLRVHLPADFVGTASLRDANGQITTSGVVGAIEATTSNGSISVKGVAGLLTLHSGNGGIDISGLPAGGSAYTENGSITLNLAGTTPNLTISAVATDPIVVEAPAGATWSTYGEVPTSQRIDIGDTTKGSLDLRTDFGEITISG